MRLAVGWLAATALMVGAWELWPGGLLEDGEYLALLCLSSVPFVVFMGHWLAIPVAPLTHGAWAISWTARDEGVWSYLYPANWLDALGSGWAVMLLIALLSAATWSIGWLASRARAGRGRPG